MSRREYPRIGRVRDMRKKWTVLRRGGRVSVANRPRCAICGEVASFRVDIEVNWFRGDDEVRNACSEHQTEAAPLLEVGVK